MQNEIAKKAEDYKWLWMFGIKKCEVEKLQIQGKLKYADEAFGCAHIAFQDLRRVLHGFGEWDKSDKTEYRKEYRICISRLIIERIEKLFELGLKSSNDNSAKKEEQKRFDDWHYCTCKQIKDYTHTYIKLKNVTLKNGFRYGAAQKWLNMTLKNMLALNKWGYLNEIIQYLHIPVDNIVIAKAREIKVSWKNSSWSALDCDQYKAYQNSLRERIEELSEYSCPIEWELKVWGGR